MVAHRFSASIFVGLLVPGLVHGQFKYGTVDLGKVAGNLAPQGRMLALPYDDHVAGQPWARSGNTVVVKGPKALRVVDTSTLRVVKSIPFRGFLCTMSFDGPRVLVVMSGCDRAWRTRFMVRRIDLTLGVVLSHVRTARMGPLAWPVGFAYGDGTIFAAQRGRGVNAIAARTGRVVFHPFIRTLSKDDGYVAAQWLGNHRLALGTSIVDVRTWSLDRHLAGGMRVAGSPGYLVAYGRSGANVYSRDGRLLHHVLGSEQILSASIDGQTLYAQVGMAYDVVDLTTGIRHAVLPQYFNELLAPES